MARGQGQTNVPFGIVSRGSPQSRRTRNRATGLPLGDTKLRRCAQTQPM